MEKIKHKLPDDFFGDARQAQTIDADDFDQILLVDDLAAIWRGLRKALGGVGVIYGWLIAHPVVTLLGGSLVASMAAMLVGMVAYYGGFSGQ